MTWVWSDHHQLGTPGCPANMGSIGLDVLSFHQTCSMIMVSWEVYKWSGGTWKSRFINHGGKTNRSAVLPVHKMLPSTPFKPGPCILQLPMWSECWCQMAVLQGMFCRSWARFNWSVNYLLRICDLKIHIAFAFAGIMNWAKVLIFTDSLASSDVMNQIWRS